MADLIPVPAWDNVFQLETTTQVLGGPGGPANAQAQNLLNRSAFLGTSAGAGKIGFNPNEVYAPGSLGSAVATGNTLHNQLLAGTQAIAVTGPRQPWYNVVSTRPAPLGGQESILTAFNGNLSKVPFPAGQLITGAATLGQPVTGYLYTPETAAHYTYLYNESGWNQATTGNDGRTSATAFRTMVFNAGQGDCMAFNASAFVTGTRAGSTHFLANPAASLFAGDVAAGAAGVYLNPYETVLLDNGFDVAAAGIVNNFSRTVATGAKSAVWLGYRAQNKGAASCDAFLSCTGKWQTGLDLAMSTTDFGVNAAAISLRSTQRIYFNNTAVASGNMEANWRSTVFNPDYIAHTTTGFTGLDFVVGAASRLQVGVAVRVNTAFQIDIASVINYADDTAAAAGGLPVGSVYRTASVLKIRVT